MRSSQKAFYWLALCGLMLTLGCSQKESEAPQEPEAPKDQVQTEPAVTAPTTNQTQDSTDLSSLTMPAEPQSFQLKWPEGKRFVYDITIDQTTSAGETQMARALNSKADQAFSYALTTTKDASTGQTHVELEFLSAKLNLEMMGNRLNYDSENKEAKESIDPMYSMLSGLDALMGEKLNLTLNQAGEVIAVEGLDAMYEKVIKALPNQAQAIAQGIVQEDQFKQLVVYPFLPDAAIAGGGTWTRQYPQVFGMSGAMEIDNTYTFHGQESDGDRTLNVVSFVGKVLAGEDQSDEMMGMSLSMNDGKNSGTIKLDQATGHMVYSDTFQEMTMKMEIPAAMKEAFPEPPPIKITLNQQIVLKEVIDAP